MLFEIAASVRDAEAVAAKVWTALLPHLNLKTMLLSTGLLCCHVRRVCVNTSYLQFGHSPPPWLWRDRRCPLLFDAGVNDWPDKSVIWVSFCLKVLQVVVWDLGNLGGVHEWHTMRERLVKVVDHALYLWTKGTGRECGSGPVCVTVHSDARSNHLQTQP